MRIVIDLDGTICTLKTSTETYEDVKVIPGAKEFIKELREQGHYIIIQTARNMATCESNIGKVIKNVGKITLDWLEKNEIEYDEIFFGKPNAQIYIDDRAFRFEDWKKMDVNELEKMAKEK
jgi:capsule biosynthesis phosphatase